MKEELSKKEIKKRLQKYWCKIFGHDYGLIEKTIFDIEMVAMNAYQLQPKVKCKMCGFVLEGLSKKEI